MGGGPTRVPRGKINRTIEDSSSEEEEIMIEKGDERGNHHHYRVKAYILFFYATMGVEEFLDWQIDIDIFFNVMDVPESKHVRW